MNPPADPPTSSSVVLVGGRLIDGRGGSPVEEAVVVVRQNRIVAAGPTGTVTIPPAAKSIDLEGATILPGLIDSHFHNKDSVERLVDFALRRGVTSLRDPGHPFKYYDTVLQSDATLPRIFLCGGHLDGPPIVWPDQAELITSTADARRTVHEHVDRGASAIKVYFRLAPEFIRAACEAAAERNVIVTSHLELVDADDAIAAGVRGVEHVTSFGTALAAPQAAASFKSAVRADSAARHELRHRLWAELDLDTNERVAPLLETIVQAGVFVSPTLALFERRPGEKDATEIEVQGYQNMRRFVGMCHAAGAKVVVGSHTWVPYGMRGNAYQRELEVLVEAGMSPREAITAATLHNAQFFGIADRLGTIEKGKLADLIVVDGRPDESIAELARVRRVMLNGRWVKQTAE